MKPPVPAQLLGNLARNRIDPVDPRVGVFGLDTILVMVRAILSESAESCSDPSGSFMRIEISLGLPIAAG